MNTNNLFAEVSKGNVEDLPQHVLPTLGHQENPNHYLGHLDGLQLHFERIIRIAIIFIEDSNGSSVELDEPAWKKRSFCCQLGDIRAKTLDF